MSYILDALRRADTERASGGIPSIHTRPAPMTRGDAPAPAAAQGSPLVWLIVGVVIALLGWLGLRLLSGDSSVPAAAPVAMAPPAQAVAAAPAPAPVPTAAVDPAAPIDVAPAAAVPAPRKSATTAVAANGAPAKVAKAGAAASEPRAGEGTGEGRIYTPGELPEDVRRALPELNIGGAMYSQTPASRMLIINGQVFHEGDKPAPGLVLEQIRLKGAVLKFKNYRYAIGY